MYCVMRASVPSLYSVYRRYDYTDWKVTRFCWPNSTSLECAESIYVKTTKTASVSVRSYAILKKKKEEIVTLGCFEHFTWLFGMLTV